MSSSETTKHLNVGFIGAGMMASAIMDGLVNKGVTTKDKVACADPYIGTVEKKTAQGYFASQSNADVCQRPNDAIIICVKPQYVVDVCKDIVSAGGDATIISVAAGITLKTLQDNLPKRRVVRVMPNTACLVGESASGYALGSLAGAEDKTVVETIFGSVGLAVEQKEDLLNAVTGVSGSGPAYVFEFIEALADGTLSKRNMRNIPNSTSGIRVSHFLLSYNYLQEVSALDCLDRMLLNWQRKQ